MFIDILSGEIEVFDHRTISGWGTLRREDGSERSAALEIHADDVLVFRFDANHERQDLYAAGTCAVMHSGFALHHHFHPGTKIELRSAETGRVLGGRPRFVPTGRPLRICALAPARTEARFLIEWIAYHLACGIERFYVADNGGEDGTSELLQRLHAASVVRRFDFLNRRYFQHEFYDRAVAELVAADEADIAVTIDCDEFIVPTVAGSVRDVMSELFADHRVSALGINWANYGTAHRIDHDGDRLVIEQYDRRGEANNHLNSHVKTAFRPARYRGFSKNVHAVDIDYGRYVASSGNPIRWNDGLYVRGVTLGADWTTLRINHYSVKSRNEFVRRKLSGPAADDPRSETHRRREDYLGMHDTNDVAEPFDPRLVAATRAEIARIEALLRS